MRGAGRAAAPRGSFRSTMIPRAPIAPACGWTARSLHSCRAFVRPGNKSYQPLQPGERLVPSDSVDADLYSPIGTAELLDGRSDHPILRLLAQRAAEGSMPGARAPGDTAKLGLVVEGGEQTVRGRPLLLAWQHAPAPPLSACLTLCVE
jgi:hypothetical protein